MRFFVTGTDTGVGKTEVSAGVLRALVKAGHRPFAFKPYESGTAGEDADSERLRRAGGGWQRDVSVYRFGLPLAPAMAARRERVTTSWRTVMAAFRALGNGPGVVEGAGGLHVPLDERHDVIDAIEAFKLPVIVVARAGLGTINHTSLTLEALQRRRLRVRGVVLVTTTAKADAAVADNRAELARRYPRVPFLGPVAFETNRTARERAFDRVCRRLVKAP